MLRVEASNLPKPRGAPRPRRLLPNPPAIARRGTSASRHEILPPPGDSPPAEELTLPQPARVREGRERWSVRLELGDEEIARLYGQGMTRGAVVWRKGMVEWRPLLVTPELFGLLRRTRTTLTDVPATLAVTRLSEPPTVPRSPRLPSGIIRDAVADAPVMSSTVAPIAFDVELPSKPRRPLEFVGVAVAAFARAWASHGLWPSPTTANNAINPLATTGPSTVCEPTLGKPSNTESASIPRISVADLPLVSAASTMHAATSRGTSRSSTAAMSSNDAPSRSALVNALNQVARAASGCGERGGPVRLVMSFGASGVARSIQVSGQELPAATRSCIIGAASRARVQAFSGDPVTVSKTL